MSNLVTVGLPIDKRLEFLVNVLRSIGEQDYQAIELIVSDNGLNGAKLRERVRQTYPRPFRLRHNYSIVMMSTHFNPIAKETNGK